ncbi:MAG TPA: hypothetical protein VNL91_04240 [Thermoanaerobaculia bacterium]|nr:hypothetical protein [Thermoanaerobaculia bacterium]
MKSSNGFVWMLAVLAAFGSWLMQQPATFTWSQTLQPYNLGSLICAITGVFLAGRFITPKKGE